MGNQNDLFEGLAMTAAENALKPAAAAGGSIAPASGADKNVGSTPPAAKGGGSGGGEPPDFAPLAGEFGDTLPLAKYAALQYLQYAVSTVKDRALPRVADGQKPVQARILYAMWEMNWPPPARRARSPRAWSATCSANSIRMATPRSTTRWCASRRTSGCAIRWSTARATSARATATSRRRCATPRRG